MQDDAVFLHAAPRDVRRAAKLLKGLGADRLRLTAGWGALAPDPASAVEIEVAFWAPRWAVATDVNPPRERDQSDPMAFGGSPARSPARYDHVRLRTTWNEPNNPTLLLPQWTGSPST